jgi:hypothetical protein
MWASSSQAENTGEQHSRNRDSIAPKKPENRIQSTALRAHRFTSDERFFRISIVVHQKAAQRGF